MLSVLKLKDRLFYGWVVVIAFLVVGITLYGITFSFGVFFKSIESTFSLTRAETSAVSSVNMLLVGVFGFLGGWALDRYGPKIVVLLMGLFAGLSLLLTSQANSSWQLFITYSLLLAMGIGGLYVVPAATVSRWFDKKRGLVLGIAGSGVGLGVIVMAPLATYLIANFDWRMAYIVIGLITWFMVIPLSRLLKKEPREIGALPDGLNSQAPDIEHQEDGIQPLDSSLLKTLRTRNFWLFVFTWLFFAFNLLLVLTHLVPHATDIGISAGKAATVLSLMGGAAIAGRVLMGIASDRIGRKLTVIVCALLQAGATLWLIWSQDLWMLYMFALVYGFAYSGFESNIGALIGDTFGLGKIGAIFGMLEFGFAVGAAIGPVVGGFIFDVSNSYSLAFLIGAVAMLITALLTVPVRRETVKTFESG